MGKRRRHRRQGRIRQAPAVLLVALALTWLWNQPSRIVDLSQQDIHRRVSSLDEVGLQDEPFCVSWDINVDDWWTQHYDWEVSHQNSSLQCFQPIIDPQRKALLTKVHGIQWSGDCNKMFQKYMSGSGWGLDISHVIDGILYALRNNVPVRVVAPIPWQYASGRRGVQPVCSSEDLECYFLPLTSCKSDNREKGLVKHLFPWRGFERQSHVRHLLEYVTRAQTWVRQRATELADSILLPTRCTAFHVRRADVVLHGKFSRRYHAIDEYISAMPNMDAHNNNNNKILLLTDDANALSEATTQFPTFNWFYLTRPRHRGPQGGWENQIPSDDPASEVIALHAEFLLVQRCDTLVHSKSNLADYFYATMLLKRKDARRIDIDANQVHSDIHNSENAESIQISREYN